MKVEDSVSSELKVEVRIPWFVLKKAIYSDVIKERRELDALS